MTKMKRMKLFGLLSIMILSFSVLPACSAKDQKAAPAPASASSAAPVAVKQQEAATIEFYDWFDEEAYMKKVVAAFQEKNPNIKVNATFVPTAEYDQKLLVALSGGTQIDTFAVASATGYATYVSKQQILPLDDLIKAKGYTMQGIKDLADQLKMDGKYYGLPHRKSAWVLYYNKDIFDKYGVPYPDGSWTWEKYAEVAKKLTAGEGDNKTWGSLNYPSTSTWWRVPANTMGANNPLKKEDLEAFKKAAKLSYDLSYTYNAQQPYSDRVGTAGGDYAGIFLQGKTAMSFNGDWLVEMLNRSIKEKGVKLNYDVAPIPHWEGKEAATTGAPTAMMITKSSKKADAAFEFIRFATSEDGAKILASNGLMAAWNSDDVNNEFLKKLEQPKNAKVFLTQKVFSQVPTDPLYNKAIKIVGDEVSLYLLKEKDLETTFTKIQQRLKDEIN